MCLNLQRARSHLPLCARKMRGLFLIKLQQRARARTWGAEGETGGCKRSFPAPRERARASFAPRVGTAQHLWRNWAHLKIAADLRSGGTRQPAGSRHVRATTKRSPNQEKRATSRLSCHNTSERWAARDGAHLAPSVAARVAIPWHGSAAVAAAAAPRARVLALLAIAAATPSSIRKSDHGKLALPRRRRGHPEARSAAGLRAF